MRVAMVCRLSKTPTGSWPLAPWTRQRQAGRVAARCHREDADMINCKNYVSNTQRTSESTCTSSKIRAWGVRRPEGWLLLTPNASPTHWLLLTLLNPTKSVLLSKKMIQQMDSDWSFIYNCNNLKTTSKTKLHLLPLTGWINYEDPTVGYCNSI